MTESRLTRQNGVSQAGEKVFFSAIDLLKAHGSQRSEMHGLWQYQEVSHEVDIIGEDGIPMNVSVSNLRRNLAKSKRVVVDVAGMGALVVKRAGEDFRVREMEPGLLDGADLSKDEDVARINRYFELVEKVQEKVSLESEELNRAGERVFTSVTDVLRNHGEIVNPNRYSIIDPRDGSQPYLAVSHSVDTTDRLGMPIDVYIASDQTDLANARHVVIDIEAQGRWVIKKEGDKYDSIFDVPKQPWEMRDSGVPKSRRVNRVNYFVKKVQHELARQSSV